MTSDKEMVAKIEKVMSRWWCELPYEGRLRIYTDSNKADIVVLDNYSETDTLIEVSSIAAIKHGTILDVEHTGEIVVALRDTETARANLIVIARSFGTVGPCPIPKGSRLMLLGRINAELYFNRKVPV